MNLKTGAHNHFFSRRAIQKDDSDQDGLDTIPYRTA
jgi:hypothetical protein